MADLESSIRRTVQAAYEAWTAEPLEDGCGSWNGSSPVPRRQVRCISWEDLEDYAEAALDIDGQVRQELARSGDGLPSRRRRRPLGHGWQRDR